MSTVPGRRLIVCCDGTNNTLTADDRDTNVLRLFHHLRQVDDPTHVLYYDPGVGSPDSLPPTGLVDWAKRYVERVGGLASGRGVYGNIAEAYLFLMRHWQGPQDRIYLFGFSRGAFTARAVAGMVNLFGLLRPEHEPLLPTLVRVYFSQPAHTGGPWKRLVARLHAMAARPGKAAAEVAGHTEENVVDGVLSPDRQALAGQIQRLFAGPERLAHVHWVGVWDTVESVGLPGPLSRANPATATLVGKRMRHVRHALALDEHRWAFLPRVYEEPGDLEGEQTLKQRWFPGAHCDIGGSYGQKTSGISNRSLDWMLAEVAEDLGIPPASGLDRRPLVRHDPLYETPWWALAGMCVRDTTPRIAGQRTLQPIEDEGGSAAAARGSVWDRRRSWHPLAGALLVGAVAAVLCGACLLGPQLAASYHPSAALPAAWRLGVAMAFGPLDAVAAVPPWPGARPAPAWAVAWHLLVVAALAYLLARATSRAFAWLAGRRRAGSPLPAWRRLGFAPLAAIGADVVAHLYALFAQAAHGMGGDLASQALLVGTKLFSAVAMAGWLACVPLLMVRLALPWLPRSWPRRRHPAPPPPPEA